MDEKFPPVDLNRRLEGLPAWLLPTLANGIPTSWLPPAPIDPWGQGPSADKPADGRTSRGILAQFDRPLTSASEPAADANQQNPWSAPVGLPLPSSPIGNWYRSSPPWVRSALPFGAKVASSALPSEPAYQPWIDPRDEGNPVNAWQRPPSVPMSGSAPPAFPQRRGDGWYYPGAQLDPTPPKDFRTRLLEALSDSNIRYYAGPGFSDALEKLARIAQVLPGSGTVQAGQDGAQAADDVKAGNYGQAAVHTAIGTANAALDWVPGGKVLATLLAGMRARTFPWARLPIAEAMERAGRSADEIWRETGLERGAKGNWRFEIPDRGFRFNPTAGKTADDGFRVAPLFEHYPHPGAQLAYPELADFQSKLLIDPKIIKETAGFSPGQIEVHVPSRSFAKVPANHEFQHAVDYLEGILGRGTIFDFLNRGFSPNEAHALYKRLADEVNARNATERMYKTEATRRRIAPQRTEEIPREQQILSVDSVE